MAGFWRIVTVRGHSCLFLLFSLFCNLSSPFSSVSSLKSHGNLYFSRFSPSSSFHDHGSCSYFKSLLLPLSLPSHLCPLYSRTHVRLTWCWRTISPFFLFLGVIFSDCNIYKTLFFFLDLCLDSRSTLPDGHSWLLLVDKILSVIFKIWYLYLISLVLNWSQCTDCSKSLFLLLSFSLSLLVHHSLPGLHMLTIQSEFHGELLLSCHISCLIHIL